MFSLQLHLNVLECPLILYLDVPLIPMFPNIYPCFLVSPIHLKHTVCVTVRTSGIWIIFEQLGVGSPAKLFQTNLVDGNLDLVAN